MAAFCSSPQRTAVFLGGMPLCATSKRNQSGSDCKHADFELNGMFVGNNGNTLAIMASTKWSRYNLYREEFVVLLMVDGTVD